MLGEHAKFKALSLENILTASDGTRKVSISLPIVFILSLLEFLYLSLYLFVPLVGHLFLWLENSN
jgi:hypothetical protein